MQSLQLQEVTKIYGDMTAVNHLNVEVGQGEIFGLLGANGAGKTTTMRMVLGLIYPDEGRILYDGRSFSQDLTKRLGYLPEERGLYPKVRVSDQILYLARLKGMQRREADANLKMWLEKFGVPEYYNKKVEELSKGNQQKIQFIAAIIHKPDILVLDEAFSGLDPVNVELLKTTVKELRDGGATIVFSTHRMEHVEELCRNICILHKSNTVLKGKLKDIKNSYPKERVILGTDSAVKGLDLLEGVESVNPLEYGYELRVTGAEAAQRVLHLAMEQTMVNRFELMEPTLNEIFIRAVGGEANE
jgi:ABC-2 type transport system ATP-binding protein